MSPNKDVRFDSQSPKWVEADSVLEYENSKATVCAWGYQFVNEHVRFSGPTDGFEPKRKYVLVEHPSGNWLKIYWEDSK